MNDRGEGCKFENGLVNIRKHYEQGDGCIFHICNCENTETICYKLMKIETFQENIENDRSRDIIRVRIMSACVGMWLFLGIISKQRWFSGRILACHAGGPGSIPGRCRVFFLGNSLFLNSILETLDPHRKED